MVSGLDVDADYTITPDNTDQELANILYQVDPVKHKTVESSENENIFNSEFPSFQGQFDSSKPVSVN